MMRQQLTCVSIVIVLDMLANVVVAWLCAGRSETSDQPQTLDVVRWPRDVPANWPAVPDRAWQYNGSGLTVTFVDGHGPEPVGHWERDAFVGEWRRDLYRYAWFQSGWPFRSMHWGLYDAMKPGGGTLDRWPDRTHGLIESGLDMPRFLNHDWQWSFQRRLPVAPLWPGFALNTLLYAATFRIILAGSFAVRRRRRARALHGMRVPGRRITGLHGVRRIIARWQSKGSAA